MEKLDAIQFNGKNDKECMNFCKYARDPDDNKPNLIILTRDGEKLCNIGDYIIRLPDGGFIVN